MDPLATGLLIVLLNKSTKLSDYFLKFKKEYFAVIKLGVETDTWDADGNVIYSERVGKIDLKTIEDTVSSLKGEYLQEPPVYSSLKYKGRPAYKYAREGKQISLSKRKVNIYDISTIDYSRGYISLNINCSSGTYVRSLAHDIGQKLGCGASLWDLRRTRIGSFDVKDSICLEEIKKMTNTKNLIDIEDIFRGSSTVIVKKEALKKIENGNPLISDMIEKTDDGKGLSEFVKIKSNNRLIAVYRTKTAVMAAGNEDDKSILADHFLLL